MRPKQVVQNWVAAFNKADAVALAGASLNGKIPKDFEVAASFKLKMEKLNSKGAIGTNYHFSDRTICQFQKTKHETVVGYKTC